jgi:hypothetical protein
MSIDEARNDSVMAQVNDLAIASCRSRRGDGDDPLPSNSNVSIRGHMAGAHVNQFAGVNNLRFRRCRLLGLRR